MCGSSAHEHAAPARLPLLGRPPASHRVHGPSALSGDIRRFWSLTFTLARTEFKLRFYGSVLGYVWTLMRPLLLFGVLWIFFTKVGHVNERQRPRRKISTARSCSARSCCSRSSSKRTTSAVRSVVDRENLVRKIHFPRLVIPLSVVLLGPVQPGTQPDRGGDLRHRRGCAADAQLARAAADHPRARDSARRAWRCCSRRCSCTSATSSRSGK